MACSIHPPGFSSLLLNQPESSFVKAFLRLLAVKRTVYDSERLGFFSILLILSSTIYPFII
jgi:hypothetical protein